MGNLGFCTCTHCTPHWNFKFMTGSYINCIRIFSTPRSVRLAVYILCLMLIQYKFLYFHVHWKFSTILYTIFTRHSWYIFYRTFSHFLLWSILVKWILYIHQNTLHIGSEIMSCRTQLGAHSRHWSTTDKTNWQSNFSQVNRQCMLNSAVTNK